MLCIERVSKAVRVSNSWKKHFSAALLLINKRHLIARTPFGKHDNRAVSLYWHDSLAAPAARIFTREPVFGWLRRIMIVWHLGNIAASVTPRPSPA